MAVQKTKTGGQKPEAAKPKPAAPKAVKAPAPAKAAKPSPPKAEAVSAKAAVPPKAAAKTVREPKATKPAVPKALPLAVKHDPLRDDHLYFFHEGTDCRAYEVLGSRLAERDGVPGAVFRVWAPEAEAVAVMGDFCGWNREAHPMAKISVGVWETFVPGMKEYDAYKYAVTAKGGRWLEKADPYAFHAETRPRTASKLFALEGYTWGDEAWRAAGQAPYEKPMNVYEVHLGSWRQGEDGALLPYAELADQLVPYVKE
ncbi:MAG: hypothetical protein LBT60_07435, partial [Oscillospiraceae bacterium]|nr:hypothetical protein [Oscillospiraceae bacterium]